MINYSHVLPNIFPVTLFANVIFPAFMTPYVTMLLFPFYGMWLILSEWVTLLHFERQEGWWSKSVNTKLTSSDIPHQETHHGKWSLFGYTLLANLVSSLVGIGVSFLLPSGLRPHDYPQPHGQTVSILQHTAQWGWYAVTSFILAYGLSIGIEGLILKRRHHYGISQSWKKAFYMNTVSYASVIVFGIVISLWKS